MTPIAKPEKRPRYFVERHVPQSPPWIRTFWTCDADAPTPKPAKSRKDAEKALKVAETQYPKEQFRIVEA